MDEFVAAAFGVIAGILFTLFIVFLTTVDQGFRHDVGATQLVCVTTATENNIAVRVECVTGMEIIEYLRRKND